MMKRIPLVFAAALLMAALLYQPIAAAQGGIDNVDASIDAILNSPAPAAEPVSAPARAIAAAKDVAAAVEAREVEAEPAAAPMAAVLETVEAPAETPAAETVVETIVEVGAAEPAPAEKTPEPTTVEKTPEPAPTVEAPSSAPTVEAPEPAANENGEVLVSMAFDEAPLPDVIRAFREASGATIISRWTNAAPQLVSLRLENKPWKQGLISILAPYGLQLVEEQRGSGVYVVSEKSTVVPRFTQTFELKHLKADDVQKLFKDTLGDASSLTVAFPSANAVVVKATDEQLRECEKMLEVLDKPSRQVYIEARFVRLNSSASKKLGMKWDSLKDWGVEINNVRGGLQYTDGEVAVYDVKAHSSDKVTTIRKTGAMEKHDYDITETTLSLIPDERTDAPLSDMTADDMTWRKASGFGGQLSIDALRLALSAFEQMDGAQMFSNPKIIVENETTARIDMTTKEPNVEIDYQAATQAGQRDSISSKLVTIPGKKEFWVGEAFFSYGITLDVTPRVSPTGLITVDIVPSISSLYDSRVIPLGQSAANYYPIIKMQRLETRFTMGDGKTAVIGGLTQTTEGNTDSGIPLLRSIPWIGPRIFGWKSREKTQEEIIIFVTVGIVDGETIEQSSGMPKNAVLGRGLLDGTIKEPGDRTDEEMFNLETKPKGFRIK